MKTRPTSPALLLLALLGAGALVRPLSAQSQAGPSPSEQARVEASQAVPATTPDASATPTARPELSRPDAQMQAVLDELAALGGKPIETLSPEEARNQPTPADAVRSLMKKQDKSGPEKVHYVDNITVKLSTGSLPARVYRPEGDGPFPVILYIHGGGWVLADLDVYDASPRALCNATGALVISTHYRLAPEHKFPAAHEDVYGVYQWVLAHGGEYKGNTRQVAVVGESAGGNMAASVCEQAKAGGVQLPVHQVLIYPVTTTDMSSPSYEEHASAKPLNSAMMKWFFQQVLASPEDAANPKLALVTSGKLAGLPPATIITAQIDPLRSDGVLFSRKLTEAGVQVNYMNYEGVTHEFFGMGAVVDKAREAVQFVAQDLKSAFARNPATVSSANP